MRIARGGEVPGNSLKKRIQKSDPFREKSCRNADMCVWFVVMEMMGGADERV